MSFWFYQLRICGNWLENIQSKFILEITLNYTTWIWKMNNYTLVNLLSHVVSKNYSQFKHLSSSNSFLSTKVHQKNKLSFINSRISLFIWCTMLWRLNALTDWIGISYMKGIKNFWDYEVAPIEGCLLQINSIL